jgi:hypothetical protein
MIRLRNQDALDKVACVCDTVFGANSFGQRRRTFPKPIVAQQRGQRGVNVAPPNLNSDTEVGDAASVPHLVGDGGPDGRGQARGEHGGEGAESACVDDGPAPYENGTERKERPYPVLLAETAPDLRRDRVI